MMECLIRSPSTTNTTNNNIIINMRVPQAPRSTVMLSFCLTFILTHNDNDDKT